MVEPKIAQLILGAGNSSRMGTPKQVLPWKNTTLIGSAIAQALRLKEVLPYVILGAYYQLIYNQINHFPVKVLKNTKWKSGMGSSISFGIRFLQQQEEPYEAVLITLIDQPLIDDMHMRALIEKFQKNKNSIIATDLETIIGVPAIFPARYFEELSQLQADYGARYLIKHYKNEVKHVPLIEKGIDIDTIEQYQRLFKKMH